MYIVVFRTEGSPTIGSGHIMRCITVAKLLQSEGWNIEFACEPSSFDTVKNLTLREKYKINVVSGSEDQQALFLRSKYVDGVHLLVVDSYKIDREFESLCRPWARYIMVIDDLANREHDADILLDQTYGRMNVDYDGLVARECKILLGSDYALLRPEFSFYRDKFFLKRSSRSKKVNSILITLGSSDPDNITLKVLKIIKLLEIDADIVVVLGSNAPYLQIIRNYIKRSYNIKLLVDVVDMASIMSNSDMAIGAGGVTSLERCCLRLPALTIITANNQALLAENLLKSKCHNVISFSERFNDSRIALELKKIYKDKYLRKHMSSQGYKACDGNGRLRVLSVIKNLCR